MNRCRDGYRVARLRGSLQQLFYVFANVADNYRILRTSVVNFGWVVIVED
jgi:hypothetical protein